MDGLEVIVHFHQTSKMVQATLHIVVAEVLEDGLIMVQMEVLEQHLQ